MKYISFVVLNLAINFGFAQRPFRGVIADSLTKQVLPFATIRLNNQQNGMIAGIDGHFSVSTHAAITHVIVSYIGYASKTVSVTHAQDNDTIFLVQVTAILSEVIILPQNEKIRRIINAAIRNKYLHNPELYDLYQCYVYYKMHVDLIPSAITKTDSTRSTGKSDSLPWDNAMRRLQKTDSNYKTRLANNHAVFSETFSKRTYKKPMQLQEDIIASRFSGLQKTYFTNLVTDVLPFHVYGDYIILNGKDYINPIAKGWQQRYDFHLVDEINSGNDTTFILTFGPKKNIVFNSLKGIVYVNSDGYAISHFISSTGDSTDDREAKIEQIYTRVNGKWFPKELNYDLILKKFPSPELGVKLNGHSVIDSVSFARDINARFDKAHPVTLGRSIDLHSEQDWQKFRPDSITGKEMNTYHFMDSLSEKIKLEKKVYATGKLAIGRLAVGMVDLAFTRLFAYNPYEAVRLGIGVYTNDKVSKYFSIGGWTGYGLKDKVWKYGASATLFKGGNKDNWFSLSYQDNYQSVGNVNIHAELDKDWFRNWLLARVDKIKEYAITGHTQKGYWEIEMNVKKQELESLNDNDFQFSGKTLNAFKVFEGNISVKYAYGQRRIPLFGYYLPFTTNYPIVYFRLSGGKITSGNYSANYFRSLAGITYTKHLNRWGKDNFRLEGGIIHAFDRQALSRSFLLAGRGFRNDQVNYFAYGGFLTMRPYDYFSDRYVSFLYKHDFDKYFWQLAFSKPFISFVHNMIYGTLTNQNKIANSGIVSTGRGYHESGLLINQLLAINYLHVANIYFNIGPFYHWSSSFDWRKNGIWVIGISAGF